VLTGGGTAISEQIEIVIAIETLTEQGLVERDETSDSATLWLTESGTDVASDRLEQLAETEITLVSGESQTTMSVSRVASRLDSSVTEVAAQCSEDGYYYERDGPTEKTLVGRDQQLEQVQTVCGQAQKTETGSLVTVSGQTGVGKTVFLEQCLEDTSGRAVRARCRETASEPYRPLRSLLSHLDTESDPFAEMALDPDDASTFDAQQTGLFHDITQLLRANDVSHVLFDDINNADRATWSYLVYLLNRLEETGIVVTVSYRSGSLPGVFTSTDSTETTTPVEPEIETGETEDTTSTTGPSPVENFEGEALDREHIELEELTRDGTRQVLEQLLDRRGVPQSFVTAIHERTDGVPLFIESTVEALLDNGEIEPSLEWYPSRAEDIDLPPAVQKTVAEQIVALGDDPQAVLTWAAYAGESVPEDVLRRACEMDGSRVSMLVDALVQADIFERQHSQGETLVSFKTSVTRESLLSESDDNQRHDALARAFEARASDDEDRSDRTDLAGTIAWHHEQAGNDATAMSWYRRAGDQAMDIYAHETATAHYNRVLDLAQQLDDREALLLAASELAEMYTILGAFDQASKYTQFMSEQVHESDHTQRASRAVLAARIAVERTEYETALSEIATGLEVCTDREQQCELLSLKAEVEWYKNEYEVSKQTSQRLIELATQIGNPRYRAEANEGLGRLSLEAGDHDTAREYFETALDIAREDGDIRTEAMALNGLGGLARRQGNVSEASEYWEETLTRAESLDSRQMIAKVNNNLAIVAYATGNYEQCHEYYEDALGTAESIGDRFTAGLIRMNLGDLFEQLSAYDTAENYLTESLATWEEIGHDVHITLVKRNLGTLATSLGEYERAEQYLRDALNTASSGADPLYEGKVLKSLGDCAREQGEYEQATEYYEEAREIATEVGNPTFLAKVRAGFGHLEYEQEAYDTARDHCDTALETFREQGADLQSAQVQRIQGLVDRETGNADAARSHLEDALDHYETAGDRHGVALTRQALGILEQSQGSIEESMTQFERAIETFIDIGLLSAALEQLEALQTVARRTDDESRVTPVTTKLRETARDQQETDVLDRLDDLAIVAEPSKQSNRQQ
jgi:tetratricopeptide (TPR) repeat protein